MVNSAKIGALNILRRRSKMQEFGNLFWTTDPQINGVLFLNSI